ncbi:mannosyl-oligosaccharide glucosidase [Medicago truncatula]|uniref:Mannosyl-oligosaccharide glucosidase n=1 Tax=Medicago truncatula TaxID=3880 RepID=A0A072TST5_MEDTR|nr:mannosyl-oligosaccharide glucosidase [Medicago truncatula]
MIIEGPFCYVLKEQDQFQISFLWDLYCQINSKEKGAHPFTGWTSTVVKVFNDLLDIFCPSVFCYTTNPVHRLILSLLDGLEVLQSKNISTDPILSDISTPMNNETSLIKKRLH